MVCNNILTNSIRNNEINMYKYNDKFYCFCSFQKMIVCSFIQNQKKCVTIDARKEDSSAYGKLLIKINKCYK